MEAQVHWRYPLFPGPPLCKSTTKPSRLYRVILVNLKGCSREKFFFSPRDPHLILRCKGVLGLVPHDSSMLHSDLFRVCSYVHKASPRDS